MAEETGTIIEHMTDEDGGSNAAASQEQTADTDQSETRAKTCMEFLNRSIRRLLAVVLRNGNSNAADAVNQRNADENEVSNPAVNNENETSVDRCMRHLKLHRLSALILFILIFATSLALTICRYMMVSQPGRFPSYIATLWIISWEVVASIFLVLLLCVANTKPAHSYVTGDQSWHGFIRRNIKLFGIVPFFVAIFVYDVFRLIYNAKCHDAWVACSSSVVRREHVTDLFFAAVRIIFLLTELIVCVKCNARDFFQNTLVLMGLAVIEATNLSCWLDALVDESLVFSSEGNWTYRYELSHCFNDTSVNISEHFVKCYNRATNEFELLESASPYLYPFIMEYLMLVIECVAGWFFHDAHTHSAPPVTNDGNAERMEPSTSNGYGSINVGTDGASSSDSVGENEPLIRRPHQEGPDQAAADQARCRFTRCPRFFLFVIVIILLGVLFLILGIFHLFLDDIGYRDFFMSYRIGYWVLLILAALLGFIASHKFDSEPRNWNGLEFLMTGSSIGPFLQCLLSLIATAALTEDSSVPTAVFLTEEISNMLHIFTQLIFYEQAKIIRIRPDETTRWRVVLKAAIMCFVVCNFVLWVEDSFIETRNSMNSWQKYYFDNWPLLYNIFNPWSLVFRFNSALLFLNVLFDKRLAAQ